MDGTVVEYRRDCTPSLLKTKGYFKTLKPEWNMIEAMLKLNRDENSKTYILTKVYPNSFPYSIIEKKEYVKSYIPEMIDNMIMVNGDIGETKSSKIKELIGKFDSDCILIDDFTENLKEWEDEGGTPVKYLNGINNTNGTVHKYSVSCYMRGNDIYQYLKKLQNTFKLKHVCLNNTFDYNAVHNYLNMLTEEKPNKIIFTWSDDFLRCTNDAPVSFQKYFNEKINFLLYFIEQLSKVAVVEVQEPKTQRNHPLTQLTKKIIFDYTKNNNNIFLFIDKKIYNI